MKSNKENKSLGLAIFFGIGVFAIIIISLIFKGIDLFRNSKFDGKHRFTVAILTAKESQILSVSPQDGIMPRLDIEGNYNLSQLRGLSIPVDSYL